MTTEDPLTTDETPRRHRENRLALFQKVEIQSNDGPLCWLNPHGVIVGYDDDTVRLKDPNDLERGAIDIPRHWVGVGPSYRVEPVYTTNGTPEYAY